jgi:phage shock protein A
MDSEWFVVRSFARLFGGAEVQKRNERATARQLGDVLDNHQNTIDELDVKLRDLNAQYKHAKQTGTEAKAQLQKKPNDAAIKRRLMEAGRNMKRLEGAINSLTAQLTNLRQQQDMASSVATSAVVFDAMRDTQTHTKAILGQIDVEEIDKVMVDVEETAVEADEIMIAMSKPIGPSGAGLLDEDDVMAMFEEEEEPEPEPQMDVDTVLPSPPAHLVSSAGGGNNNNGGSKVSEL